MIDVLSAGQWKADGRLTAVDRARAVVERVLADHHPEPLSPEASTRLDHAMQEVTRNHGIEKLPLGPAARRCTRGLT